MKRLMPRKGADYGACTHPALEKNLRWLRRTSAGWAYIGEPKSYVPGSADDQMVLYSDGWIWLVRVELQRQLAATEHVEIARGPKHELWDLFITHGRMVVSA